MFYSFRMANIKKYGKLSGLEQQKIIVSQFRRLELWNRAVAKAVLSTKSLGMDTSLPPSTF